MTMLAACLLAIRDRWHPVFEDVFLPLAFSSVEKKVTGGVEGVAVSRIPLFSGRVVRYFESKGALRFPLLV